MLKLAALAPGEELAVGAQALKPFAVPEGFWRTFDVLPSHALSWHPHQEHLLLDVQTL